LQTPHYPSLYQINTRVWLTKLSQILDCLACPCKRKTGGQRLLAVKYAGNQSQCYLRLPVFGSLVVRSRDLSAHRASMATVELDARGLYLNMSPMEPSRFFR